VEIARMLGLYRDRYVGFTVKHFHEQLVKRHAHMLGYTVTKAHLQSAGLVRLAPKRSAHRKARPRRQMVGMMLHQDASPHAWLPGVDRQNDLVVTCSTTGQAPSPRPSWWTRRGPPRASAACAMWSLGAGCSVPSTPTAAATIIALKDITRKV
jgi:hypothetical protein